MSSHRIDALKAFVSELPTQSGVYLMKNIKEKVIYVGKAKNLRARVRSYFHDSADLSLKTKFLVSHIEKIDFMLTKTEVEAFLLEASLIKKFRPRYNIRLKDDKAYPYIKCSVKDAYPRFYVSRKVQSDGAVYFGPYTSGMAVRETIRFLNQTFKIRDCSDAFMRSRKRPCMTYQIGRCTAPCMKLVNEVDYGSDIEAALRFLHGKNGKLVKDLARNMKVAAKEERFEAAAKFRDSLQAVEAILEKQSVIQAGEEKDQDVIAFVGDQRGTLIEILNLRGGRLIGHQSHFLAKLNASDPQEDVRDWLTNFLNQYYAENFIPDEVLTQVDLGGDINKLFRAVLKERGKEARIAAAIGESGLRLIELALTNARRKFEEHVSEGESLQKGLEEIQKRFSLANLPRRIECFDISNLQGGQNVASQVVFEDGVPKKEDYRLYKIRSVEGANDFASMKEVLTRRLGHAEYDDPDLIVVDGGKGQLKMAIEVLSELGRPDLKVVGLAKARTVGEFTDTEIAQTAERFFLPGRQNPVTFASNSEALHILVGLRDEAHRFAITYHRKLRGKQTLESELDDVSGLGEKRKKILLTKFKSLEEIRLTSVEDLAALPTFNRVLAERLHLHLNQSLERDSLKPV